MEALASLLYELGRMKRIERSGWNRVRVGDRIESIADHSFRVSVIAYFLAQREKADTAKAVLMGLFHDVHETRLGDLDPIAKGLISNLRQSEERTRSVQLHDGIPNGATLRELLREFELRHSLEAKIARDADIIECELQAREYGASSFIDSFHAEDKVSCGASVELLRAVRKTPPDRWWQILTAIPEEQAK